MDNVIDFKSRKSGDNGAQKVASGKFEFHLHATDDGASGEVVSASGFLKFGPQFIAVVSGPEDTAPVDFAVATPLVKYVKKIDTDGSVQGTLDLA